MDLAHIEILIKVFIELILNFVGDNTLFDRHLTVLLDWERTSDVMESNEAWVLEIIFRRN